MFIEQLCVFNLIITIYQIKAGQIEDQIKKNSHVDFIIRGL